MTAREFEIIQRWLGLKPYILLEFYPGPDGVDDLRCGIETGGGPDSMADIGAGLAMALNGLPAADNPYLADLDELVTERPELADAVAVIRQRFGWALTPEGQ